VQKFEIQRMLPLLQALQDFQGAAIEDLERSDAFNPLRVVRV
jgi:hypothetical protein